MELEEILNKHGLCIAKTHGDSMYPMLIEGKDKVLIIKPTFPLKKYDVPVYWRDGHYTMHRIIKVTKKGQYVICGDNRTYLEKDITENDIIGVLDGIYRDNIFYSCNDDKYLKYAKKICQKRIYRKIKQIFHVFVRILIRTD